MKKMTCETRFSWPPTATVVNFGDDDEAVILILNADAAAKCAMDQFNEFGDYPKRLEANYNTLSSTGLLYIPMLHMGFGGKAEFSDGRHRTLTLQRLGFSTVPVLASLETAQALQHMWGSIETANAEYTFNTPEVSRFVGI
ncbi:MAG: hypothetical protein K0S77_2056 [Pseudomonas sp.]|nr:hypothetical protein [Pseudomonas sp.]